MRINKYIAACGAASRRGADALIAQGKVEINGSIATQMGTDVDPDKDVVMLEGRQLLPENKKVYIILNKPAGVLSSCTDDRGRKTVVDLLHGIDSRVFPVGRLDYDTEGLLLLTNDGDFAYQCTHPKHEVTKTYYAVVRGVLTDKALDTLRGSVKIDGVPTSGAKIEVATKTSKRAELYVTIHEGKNRHIKKMFQLAGCKVTYLKRVAVGALTLGSLLPGQWRKLTLNDRAMLTQQPERFL